MNKKAISFAASAALAVSAVSAFPASAADNNQMRDISTAQIVKEMGIGINLGNTYEACGDWITGTAPEDYYTSWGSVVLTEDIIKGYAEAGFESLRVPVAWSNLMTEENGEYIVSEDYLASVKQTVDWALDAGLYVIINEHWDYGWLKTLPENKEEGMKKYLSIWEQVADAFKDYGDHLIFESQNEELGAWEKDVNGTTEYYYWNRWGGETVPNGKQLAYDLCNEVNQEFVDLIRASGGNNAKRHLLISGFCTDIDCTCDELFKMPNDPANRMAVSVHYYTPTNYALSDNDKSWGTEADYAELNGYMDMLKERFVDNNVPVIIGECCAGMQISLKEEGTAREYFTAVCEAAYSRGMCPVLWDITYASNQPADNQIYNRRTQKMQDPQLQTALNNIVANDKQTGIISGGREVTKKYLDAAFDLGVTVNSGAAPTYSSSNEKVATIDKNGKVTILSAGKTTITVFAPATDKYTAAAADITLTVEKLPTPPNAPAENMTVAYSVDSTNKIKLADGWSWTKNTALEPGKTVTVKAVYSDTNYSSRSATVNITRVIEGDANIDGETNIKDVISIQKYINAPSSDAVSEAVMDINSDGEVNIKDVIRLQKLINGDK